MRRRHLLLALGALAAGPASAQEAAPQAEAPPRPAPRPRRWPPAAEKPAPMKAPPSPPPPDQGPPRLEAAPVPNRDLEAPHAVEKDHPRLSPDVIHRRLPSRGMAAEGSPNQREEQLFKPAPGARLSLPFSY